MDPAKCLEILSSRGTCGGPAHDSHSGTANGHHARGQGPGRGQVINLATGTNETDAAARAVSGLVSSLSSTATNVSSQLRHPQATSSPAPALGLEPEAVDNGETRPDSGDGVSNGTGASGSESINGSHSHAVNGASPAASSAASMQRAGAVARLEGMSPGELVASFRRAQEERVALYRKFNGGLSDALRSGDFSGYPALCCEITAAFAVLSNAVKSIEGVLCAKADTKPLASIIRRVQGHEKELLTVTAAHHLESMREARALGMGPGMTAHSGRSGDANSSSPAHQRLLADSVRDLKRRAEVEAEAVTDLLEELRYESEGLC